MTDKEKKITNSNNTPKKKTNKKKKKHPYLWSRIFAVILIMTVVGGLVVGGILVNTVSGIDTSTITAQDFSTLQTSRMYDAQGNEIYDMGYKLRENITYDDLPQSLIDAFVAIEDSRFFEHNGFDVPRFTKAALENILDTVRTGRVVFGQGGSTFTMQLVKNTYYVSENFQTGEVVRPESSGVGGIQRKLSEILIATTIENTQLLTKEQIFTNYLNLINFGAGNNIVGVQNSARAFFNKDVKDLNILESAFLAGVINAPSVNNPYYSLDNAERRTHEVLYQMYNHGYISKEEYNVALNVPIENIFVEKNSNLENYANQAYIDVALQEIKDFTAQFYNKELDPYTTPMRIYTAMNPTVQTGIDKIQRREIDELDHGTDSHIQISSAAIKNNTGEIVGVLGGYDYEGALMYNRAIQGSYQPGSSIKPLIDYALAFEHLGYSTSHILDDTPYTYAGTDHQVNNWDFKYKGQITIMDAVADSRNTPALRTLDTVKEQIGGDAIVDYLKTIGFNLKSEYYDPQWAIGSNKIEISTINLAGAYSMIYNGGTYIQPHTITHIELIQTGEVIEADYKPIQVLSPESAYLTTRLMNYTVNSGGFTGVTNRSSYEVFSKTGSVGWDENGVKNFNVPANSTKDKLMVTGTSEYSIATWTGFDTASTEYKSWFTNYHYNLNINGKTNSYILDLLEDSVGKPSTLSRPSGVIEIEHILGIFPYQKPLENMNPDMITNGLIKSEFAQLATPQPSILQELEKQTVTMTQNGGELVFDVDLTEYPDKDKLTIAEATLPPELGGGKRLYDESWIYGAVKYFTEVRINGNVIKTESSDTNKMTITVPIESGTNVYEVCSYYGYDKSDSKSSTQCSKFDNIEQSITVPDFTNRSFNELQTWAATNQIQNLQIEKINDSIDKFNLIKQITITPNKTTLTSADLANVSIHVVVYDYQVNAKEYSLNNVKKIFETYKIPYNVNGNGSQIKSFTVNNMSLDTFSLSDTLINGSSVIINTN